MRNLASLKKSVLVVFLILFYSSSFTQNTSLLFDGKNDYVSFQYEEQYSLNDFTMEAWIKPYNYSNKESVILCNYNAEGKGFKWGLDKKGYVFFELNGYRVIDEDSKDLRDKGCIHLAVTRKSDKLTFYKDGELMGMLNYTNTQIGNSADLYMGADINNVSNSAFHGTLDNVYIWDKYWGNEDIKKHKKDCLSDFKFSILITDMDETNQSQILHDYSEYMNHGKYGSTLWSDENDPKIGRSCIKDECCLITPLFTSSHLTASIGEQIIFTNTSSSADQYEWFVNGTSESNLTNFDYVFQQPGEYVITLLTTDTDEKCADFYSEIVTIQTVFCGNSFEDSSATFGQANFTKEEIDSIQHLYGEYLLFDRFGNTYLSSDIGEAIPKLLNVGCASVLNSNGIGNAGKFTLSFEDIVSGTGQNFDNLTNGQEYVDIVCQVFNDLSDLLEYKVNGCGDTLDFGSVNIRIQSNITPPTSDGGIVGGLGGATYALVNDNFENLTAYQLTKGSFPASVHGGIQINFHPNINWYTNLNGTSAIAPSESDLYQVVLHEAMHILGIASRINKNTGLPNGPDFTTWDYLMMFNSGSLLGQDVVIGNMVNSGAVLPNDLNNSCTNNDPEIVINNVAGTIPPISETSLSHLQRDCNNNFIDYIMDPITMNGTSNLRQLHIHEVEAMASLGYNISGDFAIGMSNYTNYNVVNSACEAFDDNFIACTEEPFTVSSCEDSTLIIDLLDFVQNDIGYVSLNSIALVDPTLGVLTQVSPTVWELDPEDFMIGNIFLEYQYQCISGSSTGIITVNVRACSLFPNPPINTGWYRRCGSCGSNPENAHTQELHNNLDCNLVCNPEFYSERIPQGSNCNAPENFGSLGWSSANAPGWGKMAYTPEYRRGISTDISLANVDGNGLNGEYAVRDNEGFYTVLEDYAPDVDYLLSLYTRRNNIGANLIVNIADFEDTTLVRIPTPITDNGSDNVGGDNVINLIDFNISGISQYHRVITKVHFSNTVNDYEGIFFSSEGNKVWIDQVELVPDIFTAGEDVAIDCGQSAVLGQEFCDLSNTEYSWYDADSTLIGSTSVITVSPSATTMYILERNFVSHIDSSVNGLPAIIDLYNNNSEPFTSANIVVRDTVVVTVFPGDNMDASFTANNDNCSAYSFVPNSIQGNHFWDFGDGNTSTTALATNTYFAEGTYIVSHTIEGLWCEVDTIRDTINVESAYFIDIEKETTSIAPYSSGNPGSQITYTITVDNNGPSALPNGSLVTDEIPEDLFISNYSTTFGAISLNNNTIEIDVSNLSSGGSAVIIVEGLITLNASTNITNCAAINLANNCGQISCATISLQDSTSLPTIGTETNMDCISPEILRSIGYGVNSDSCMIFCEGDTITYFTENPNTGSTYNWIVNGGDIINLGALNHSVTVAWINPNVGSLIMQEHVPSGVDTVINSMEQCVLFNNKPQASFTTVSFPQNGITQYCQNNPVCFDNLSIGEGELWHTWDFGDGNVSFEENPCYTYSSIGSYTVTLTTRNECNCISIDTFSIEILPSGNISLECIEQVCEGDSARYTINGLCTTYTVDVLGGTIVNQTNNELEIAWDLTNPSANGQGQIFITGNDCPDFCSSPVLFEMPIMKNEGLILGAASVCRTDKMYYEAEFFPFAEYVWSISSGMVTPTSNPHIVFIDFSTVSEDSSTVILGVAYEDSIFSPGCKGGAAIEISIADVVEITSSNNAHQVCNSEIVTYSFNLPAVAADWAVYDDQNNLVTQIPITTNSNSITVDWSVIEEPGTYLVSFADTTGELCLENNQYAVQVEITPPVISERQLTGQIDNICPGKIYQYMINSDSIVIGNIVEWYIDGGIPSYAIGESVDVIWGNTPQSITILQTNPQSSSCPSDSFTINVGLYTPPTFNINSTSGSDSVCAGMIESYTLTPNIDPDLIQWSITDPSFGTIIDGEGIDNITIQWNADATATSTYNTSIQVQVFNCGVSTTVNQSIAITPPDNVQILSDDTLCTNQSISFAAVVAGTSTPVTATTINWIIRNENGAIVDIINDGGSNLQYNFQSSETYSILAEAIGVNGCDVTRNAVWAGFVSPTPVAHISSPSQLCDSNTTVIDLFASVQDVIGVPQIDWYENNSLVATGVGNYSTSNVSNGFFNVTIEDNLSGCSSVSDMFMIACPDTSNSSNGCQGGNFSISSVLSDCNKVDFSYSGSPNGALSWYINNELIYEGNSNFDIRFPYSGYYSVRANDCNTNREYSTFTIPVVADFIVELNCGAQADKFDVTFTDISNHVDGIPITNLAWSISPSPGAFPTGAQSFTVALDTGTTYYVTLTATTAQGICTKIDTITMPSKAVADFSVPNQACEDNLVPFTDLSTGNIIQWDWNYGDNSVLVHANATSAAAFGEQYDYLESEDITPSDPFRFASYTAHLTTTDIFGCQSQNQSSINVWENRLRYIGPDPDMISLGGLSFNNNVSFGGDSILCEGDSSSLTFNYDNGFINRSISQNSYNWVNDTDTLHGNPLTVTASGNYMVSMTDNRGCRYIHPDMSNILVANTPNANIETNGLFCEDEIVDFNAFAGNGYLYDWNTSWTTQNNPEGSQFSDAVPNGGHLVDVIVTDTSVGCADTSLLYFSLNATPDATLITASPVCADGNPVALTATLPNNTDGTIYWSTGDVGNTTNVVQPMVYGATFTDDNGCSSPTAEFLLSTLPDLSAFALKCKSVCYDQFPDQFPDIPFRYDSYTWYLDGNVLAFNTCTGICNTITGVAINSAGVYSLEVSVDGCSFTTTMLDLEGGCCPEMTSATCTDSVHVEFKVVITIPFDSITGINISSDTGAIQNVVFQSNGTNNTLVVFDYELVADTVYDCFEMEVYNVSNGTDTSILCDYQFCNNISCTANPVLFKKGKEEEVWENIANLPQISIVPNPAKDQVAINYSNLPNGKKQLVLVNMLGQVQEQQQILDDTGTSHIDVFSYASGVYIVHLMIDDKTVSQQKLVVE